MLRRTSRAPRSTAQPILAHPPEVYHFRWPHLSNFARPVTMPTATARGHCERCNLARAGGRPRESGGRGATRDPPIPGASRRRRPSPARRSGSPPGDRGSYWSLRSFPGRGRIAGWSTHPERTQSESSRGLSQPLGIHLNSALGLSNQVGPPQSTKRNNVRCSCTHGVAVSRVGSDNR